MGETTGFNITFGTIFVGVIVKEVYQTILLGRGRNKQLSQSSQMGQYWPLDNGFQFLQ